VTGGKKKMLSHNTQKAQMAVELELLPEAQTDESALKKDRSMQLQLL
jgi:hypothetical protein